MTTGPRRELGRPNSRRLRVADARRIGAAAVGTVLLSAAGPVGIRLLAPVAAAQLWATTAGCSSAEPDVVIPDEPTPLPDPRDRMMPGGNAGKAGEEIQAGEQPPADSP